MSRLAIRNQGKETPEQSLMAAKQYIDLFRNITEPTPEQEALFAGAHYTLSQQVDISQNRAKMHLNAALTVLQQINHPQLNSADRANNADNVNSADSERYKQSWKSKMAHVHYKRAEIFESEGECEKATLDYLKALSFFENDKAQDIYDEDKLMLSQCAISLADLLVAEAIDEEMIAKLSIDNFWINQPLYYVNFSLEYLSKIDDRDDDEILCTLAYSHELAGIILGLSDPVLALNAFRLSLRTVFKAEPNIASTLLLDIYNSMGLLYEQEYQDHPFQKEISGFYDDALIYFTLTNLFNPHPETITSSNTNSNTGNTTTVEGLFDCIYRALDPYLSPLSLEVVHDFIDALIFTYYCVSDNTLPNQNLCRELNEAATLNSFAQHIYWLVIESFRRECNTSGLLEITEPFIDFSYEPNEISQAMQIPTKNKVHYLKIKENTPLPA